MGCWGSLWRCVDDDDNDDAAEDLLSWSVEAEKSLSFDSIAS